LYWDRKRSRAERRDKLKTDNINVRRAILWDLDGTIVNSEPYHRLAWREIFAQQGVNFNEDIFQFGFGRRNDEIICKYFGQNLSQPEIDAIAAKKEETFRRLIKDNIKAFPGTVELIKLLAGAGFQIAIVSSTPIENVRLITEALGIKKYFKFFITGKDVTEGKPSPQGFLLAAQKLKLKPEDCVVMEDAVAGVKAAKSAGMYCIAVTNTRPGEDLAEADIVVNSLEQINVKSIEQLFSCTKK
jgi:beta-phosphoglucomutase